MEHRQQTSHTFKLLIATSILIFLLVIMVLNPWLAQPRSSLNPSLRPQKTSIQTSYTPPPPVVFSDHTLDAGLIFSHLQGDDRLTGLNEVLGPGACAFDYDNDGWVDLFLVNGSGQTRYYGKKHWWQRSSGHALYRNTGNGKFNDVTKAAGLDRQSWGMGCVNGDFDNDGNPDLLITNYGANFLYRNNGDGTFSDITSESGISGNHWSTSAAVADFDRDGLLDIYIVNYIDYKKGARTYEPDSQFSEGMSAAFDSTLYDGESNRLYRNLGNMKFSDVTHAAGVDNAGGRGLGAIWIDVFNDLLPDLLIINDKGSTPNTLLINQGDGTFTEAENAFGVQTALGHMGVSAGDTDNDNDLDLVIGSDNKHPNLLLVNGDTPTPLIPSIRPADKQFREMAREVGIGNERTISFAGWSPGLFDFNNDGWLDPFMTNGLTMPDPDSPRVTIGQAKQLWINQGDGTFKETQQYSRSALADFHSARGAVFADFDNDGDIDVYVAHNNDPGQLLLNQSTTKHWLGLKLTGSSTNHDAIGTKVYLTAKNSTQFRTVSSSNGFLSDSDRRIHFGLADLDRIDSLRIVWPDNSESAFNDIPLDHYVSITQGESGFSVQATPEQTTSSPATSLDAITGTPSIPNQMLYMQWQVAVEGIEPTLPLIDAALVSGNTSLRLAAIEILGSHPHAESLVRLIRSLSDPNKEVRVASIYSLRQYEDEVSMRWLLRAFSDPSPDVRVAITNCFAYFFREEEAMVNRKYLAVPFIIRLLEDPFPEVRITAIRALADAERYRAVEPLITLLSDPDETIQSEAARALGLIRERKATTALLSLLRNRSQPAVARAQALFALKRLGSVDVNAELSSILQGTATSGKRTDILSSLAFVKAIYADPDDGIVIDRKWYSEITIKWLSVNIDFLFSFQDTYATQSLLLAIDILHSIGTPAVIPLLDKLTYHPTPMVRTAAFSGLIDIDKDYQQKHAIRALNDTDISVRQALLEHLDLNDIVIPAAPLYPFLEDPNTITATIKRLIRSREPSALTRAFNIARDSTQSVEARTTALDELAPIASTLPPLPPELLLHPSEHIRKSALTFLAAQNTDQATKTALTHALNDSSRIVRNTAIAILSKISAPWAARQLAKILLDKNANLELRRNTLEAIDTHNQANLSHALLKIVKSPQDPLFKDALLLITPDNNMAFQKNLWRIIKNKTYNIDARFAAAKALMPHNGHEVLSYLSSR